MAERIARTEGARARYDAFMARNGEDEDVVAYKWKLGSRHPVEDICDMYANADLYGLGKGIFPKDKVIPQPAHPHCLCHYAPVYWGEIDEKKRSNNVEENGRAWLAKQPLHIRQAILGVKGEQEWKAGRVGWMEKARNLNVQVGEYFGLKSRLRKFVNKAMGKPSLLITVEDLPKIKSRPSVEENVRNTNPKFYSDKSEIYNDNCQKCVPTFELRMRGYDVQAKWFDKRNFNSNEEWLIHDPFSAFYDADIKEVPWDKPVEILVKELKKYGEGARVEIALLNIEKEKGHVVVGCNDRNIIKFLDTQTGKSFSFDDLNDRIKIKYARIDTLKINENILSDICEWRRK